eukprot:CAMPEP_0176277364 /NCGR_PEP_ID=MMETSP0121_2-20121125/48239_1 /TAXON_ID=160619 /ORGANISM="Kryptoperidinium foliaceum, Strain CCMP 1326" /LENGTH=32 /DNA_ID= /DNA_START= /DNA_END= /DNA_ORIENTATION=
MPPPGAGHRVPHFKLDVIAPRGPQRHGPLNAT